MENNSMSLGKRLLGTIIIPLGTFLIVWTVCRFKGIALFATEGSWIAFFRAAASVMLTTLALDVYKRQV